MPVRAYIRKGDDSMCEHNPNDKNTTIVFSNFKTMQFPEVKFGKCEECKKTFTFVKVDGKHIEK